MKKIKFKDIFISIIFWILIFILIISYIKDNKINLKHNNKNNFITKINENINKNINVNKKIKKKQWYNKKYYSCIVWIYNYKKCLTEKDKKIIKSFKNIIDWLKNQTKIICNWDKKCIKSFNNNNVKFWKTIDWLYHIKFRNEKFNILKWWNNLFYKVFQYYNKNTKKEIKIIFWISKNILWDKWNYNYYDDDPVKLLITYPFENIENKNKMIELNKKNLMKVLTRHQLAKNDFYVKMKKWSYFSTTWNNNDFIRCWIFTRYYWDKNYSLTWDTNYVCSVFLLTWNKLFYNWIWTPIKIIKK